MAKFQGPVKPGTSESAFRDTGKSVPSYQGPTRPGDNVNVFRDTGRSTGGGVRGRETGGSGGGSGGSSSRQREAEAKSQAEAKRQAELKAKQEAELRKQEEAKRLSQIKAFREKAEASRQEKLSTELQEVKKLELQRTASAYYKPTGTRTDLNPEYNSPEVFLQPTIYQKQTGSFVDETGQVIPVTETRYSEGALNSVGLVKDRLATQEEANLLRDKKLIATTNKPNKIIIKTKDILEEIKKDIYQADQGGKATFESLGITDKKIDLIVGNTPVALYFEKLKRYNVPYAEEAGDIYQGFVSAPVKDVINQPFSNVALYGAGYGLGFGFKGVSTGLSKIPKAGKYLSPAFKVGAVGYGGYLGAQYGALTAKELLQARETYEAGSKLGLVTKDIALLGFGFSKGEKGFDVVYSEIKYYNLPKLNVKQGVYPSAPASKQLDLFRKNIIKEISDKPVAFHTTANRFYQAGEIKPNPGSSEISGFYTSTYVSTPFAKIKGSSPNSLNSLEKLKQALKELLSAERDPGIAILEPKGFREVKVGYSDFPLFPDQKYIKGKGYAFFKESPKQGFLDLPNIKSEIEAIARPDAGSYKATGKKFATEISGVKVQMDGFKYVEDTMKKNIDDYYRVTKEILTGKTFTKPSEVKVFNPESYSKYQPSSKLNTPVSFNVYPDIDQELKSLSQSQTSSYNPFDADYLSPASLVSPNTKASSLTSSGYSSSGYSSSGYSSSGYSSLSNLNSNLIKSYNSIASNIISSQKSLVSLAGLSSSQSSPYSAGKSYSPVDGSGYKVPPPAKIKGYLQGTKSQGKSQGKSLGEGYWVYVRKLKSRDFTKINNYPLTKARAQDIGAYYTDTTLARTFKIKKANLQAQPDYNFNFIQEGYFNLIKNKLRNFRIKNKQGYNINPNRYIEKSRYVGDTKKEINQLKAFQEKVKRDLSFKV